MRLHIPWQVEVMLPLSGHLHQSLDKDIDTVPCINIQLDQFPGEPQYGGISS